MTSAAGQLGYMLATGMGRQSNEVAKKKAKQKPSQDLESEIASLLKVSYDSHDSWGVLGMGYCYFKGGCSGIDRNITRYSKPFSVLLLTTLMKYLSCLVSSCLLLRF